jgi:tape measure domain-containing protein
MTDIRVDVELNSSSALNKLKELNKTAKYTDESFKEIKNTFDRFGNAAIALDRQRTQAFKQNLASQKSALQSFAQAAISLEKQKTTILVAEYNKQMNARKKRIQDEVKASENSFTQIVKKIKKEGAEKTRIEQKATNDKLKLINQQLTATKRAAEQERQAWQRSIQATLQARRQQAAAEARLRQAGVKQANVAALREFNAKADAMISLKKQQAAATKSTSLFSQSFKQLAARATIVTAAMTALKTAVFGTTVAIAKMVHVANILNASFESNRNALMAVTHSETIANEETQYAIDLAKRYKLDIAVLTKQYAKFAIAAQLAGMSNGEVKDSFEAVSAAIRVLNLNTQQQDRVFLALEQMASKSTVQMEELKRQLGDVLPGSVQIGARAMGYGAGEMQKFFTAVRNGTVESATFIPKFAAELEKLYGPGVEKAIDKYTAKIQGVSNEWKLLVANFGQSTREIAAFGAGMVEYPLQKFNEFTNWMRGKAGLNVAFNQVNDELTEFQKQIFKAGEDGQKALNKLRMDGVRVEDLLPDQADAALGLRTMSKEIEPLLTKLRMLREAKGLNAESWWDRRQFKKIAEELQIVSKESLDEMSPKEMVKKVVEYVKSELPKAEQEFAKIKKETDGWIKSLDKLPDASVGAIAETNRLADVTKILRQESAEYLESIDLRRIQQQIDLTKVDGLEKEKLQFMQQRLNEQMEMTNKLAKKGVTDIEAQVQAFEDETDALWDAKEQLYGYNEAKRKASELSEVFSSALEDEANKLLNSSDKFKSYADNLDDIVKELSGGNNVTPFNLSQMAREFKTLVKNNDIQAAQDKLAEFRDAARDLSRTTEGSESDYVRSIIQQVSEASKQVSERLREQGEEIKLTIGGPTAENAAAAAADAKALVEHYLNQTSISFKTILQAENVTLPSGATVSYDDLINNRTWYHTVKVKYEVENDIPPGVGDVAGVTETDYLSVATEKFG